MRQAWVGNGPLSCLPLVGAGGREDRYVAVVGGGAAPGVWAAELWVWGVAGGSQAYLWPAGTICWVPGDMMIDWVAPRRRGVRPLSLIGPSAVAGVAGGHAI
jgi:hypothetical protein